MRADRPSSKTTISGFSVARMPEYSKKLSVLVAIVMRATTMREVHDQSPFKSVICARANQACPSARSTTGKSHSSDL